MIITKNGLKPVDYLLDSCQRRAWVMVKRNNGGKGMNSIGIFRFTNPGSCVCMDRKYFVECKSS
jgi:hypothetical protein